jgi:hypothetical protein
LRVLNEQGDVLAEAHTHGRSTAEIPLAWKAGATYRVTTDRGDETTVAAPRNPPALAIRVHAPLGQEPHEFFLTRPFPKSQQKRLAVPAAPGERLDVLLEIEKLADDAEATSLQVRMAPEPGAAFSMTPVWEGHR